MSLSSSAAITVSQAAEGDAYSKQNLLNWKTKADSGDADFRELYDAGTSYARRKYGKSLEEIASAEDVVEPLPVEPPPPEDPEKAKARQERQAAKDKFAREHPGVIVDGASRTRHGLVYDSLGRAEIVDLPTKRRR